MNHPVSHGDKLVTKEDVSPKWVADILKKYEEKVGFVTPPICEKTLCKIIEELKEIRITIEPDKKISTFDEGLLMPIRGGFIIKYGTLNNKQEKFSKVRIRSTICHELAHILSYDCTSLIPKLQMDLSEDLFHEIARYLLLPVQIVKEKFLEKTNPDLIQIFEELSREFQVSRMLIIKRVIEDLSLVEDTMVTFWKYKGEKSRSLNKRVETSEKLKQLPRGLKFPAELREKINYDDEKTILILKGYMTENEKDKLVGLSEDNQYKEAVKKLFQKSQIHYYQTDSKLSPKLRKLLHKYWRNQINIEAWDKVVSRVAFNDSNCLPESLFVGGKRAKNGRIKSIPFKIQCEPLYNRSKNLHFYWKDHIKPISDLLSVKKFDLNILENGQKIEKK